MSEKQQIFRGCLLGLAVGDAMGYTVDSRSLAEIRQDYGPNGLLGYDLVNGYADVTSYTQLAAFTANGMLMGLTRQRNHGNYAPLLRYIAVALREWSRSQHFTTPEQNFCWLSRIPEMKRRRCLDTRMLDTLERKNFGTLKKPGFRYNLPSALTEVIPLALLAGDLNMSQDELDRMGAEIIALTHGDPIAFLSGAALTHILCGILKDPKTPLNALLGDTVNAIQLQFGRDFGQTTHLWELFQMAQVLASSDSISQVQAMEQLSCRNAAEVLAGALYACLTCGDDFDAAMITSVNHSGRSAAVGAVAGALLGAKLGADALPGFYLDCLEPTKYLLELADDLMQGCPMDQPLHLFDDDWDRKYLHAGF